MPSDPPGPSSTRARARDLGIAPGTLPAGPTNTLTDVPGVRVGHTTVDDGGDLHTGVTAVVPEAVDRPDGRLRAGLCVGNGFGKLIGATQLLELGEIETPVLLTGTLSAFRVADALVTHMIGMPGAHHVRTLNPVVGETNDGFLSDIRRRPVTEDHVLAAIRSAGSGPVAEGCVGAGTGTVALGFKGGIGSASRVVELGGVGLTTLGVLVQTNFSGTLTVLGVPVPADEVLAHPTPHPDGNSCMVVVAVDAPLDGRQLGRLARRAVFGLARVGSDYATGSGDYAVALATSTEPSQVRDEDLDPLFRAALEAVEEAVLNSLFRAHTTRGHHGHVSHEVPLEVVVERCRRAGVLSR
ncbi:MAG TPA: P1 family peptidase [Segeticoccus sp.]|uniref:P1 family peptidase n=1 Tax=Segeticoccus sp. TaxID=2706531 RepID=UPI002D7FE0A8|nr:P1 family peptidase [Segeticoccus sp.]HET8599981.1 P1 family peptidase [Segeticoccus sp.]